MFSWRKPNDEQLARFLHEQSSLGFTYPAVGATANWKENGEPPAGFRFDRAEAFLGKGLAVLERAADALRCWRQFDVGWAGVTSTATPLEPGRVVAVQARVFGLWTMHACRIAYVLDEDRGPSRRFGFGYGTLPGHAESGEEQFLVHWNRETDVVTYEVAAFVRPRHPLAVLAAPYAKFLADRFRRDSAEAMRKAVKTEEKIRVAAANHS